MRPLPGQAAGAGNYVENVIAADGCIDLVVDFAEKQIGYAGISKTHSDFMKPGCHMGARLKPGAFCTLTGIPATEAMDAFLPINEADKNFDVHSFFELPFHEAKIFFRNYIGALIGGRKPDRFTSLFDRFSLDIPAWTTEVYEDLHCSPKQCQRLFYKHFGLSPKTSLSIIRFQKCLEIIASGKASPNDVLAMLNFHDQSHFINDFKKNIGLTPLELTRKWYPCKTGVP